MTKHIILFLSVTILLYSCTDDKKTFENAGGVFKMCLSDFPSVFTPNKVTDVHSATVMSQVMEGLISFNPEDMKIQPQLAKSWKVSSDNMSYDFEIRQNVLFHECEVLKSEGDRTLTPEDIVFSFEFASSKDEKGNPTITYSSFFKGTIKGVDSFHEGKSKTISGIKVKGNHVTIELNKPDANFLYKLGIVNCAISSKKVVNSKTKDVMIGTGPFCYQGIEENEKSKITLIKNADYYMTDAKGNTLPYLDAVEFYIETKKLEELEMFENNETHFIASLPTSRISAMLEGRMKDFNGTPPVLILRNNPLIATNYYFFNMNDKRFADLRVRQAFNYAINRNEITQNVLRGQAYENGIYGITPPISKSFKGYDFTGIKSFAYDFNPEKAKALLKEAGYPNGLNFGSVDLKINIGDMNSAVAEEIASQLSQNLGININIDASSFEQKNEDATNSKGALFRAAWFADYISPETFLINFYGKIVPKNASEPSKINQARYVNPKFDKLYEQGQLAKSTKEALFYFSEAEKELMKDPPFIPLWYNGDIQLVYSKVRNFHENPLNYFILKEVYFKEWTKSEWENRIKTN